MTDFLIEDGEYEQRRRRLMQDPIVRDMALTAQRIDLTSCYWPDGTPRSEWMQHCNAEYRRQGGSFAGGLHMGAVAEALYALLGVWLRHEQRTNPESRDSKALTEAELDIALEREEA